MTEAQIQRSICKVLDMHGVIYSVTDASRSFTPNGEVRAKVRKGWPDITAILSGGKALMIECKSEKGKLRPEQKIMLDRLEKQGALTLIARSGHEVYEFLQSLSQR